MSSKYNTAIRARNVAKCYTISHQAPRHTTLGEAFLHWAKNPFAKQKAERFWALKEISFEVERGEVIGIVGRNGAGKSTLLKILSQITEPTAGEIEVHGRVGSLLEVGTGFHPELTGRENIFLNGAILGMRRKEIAAQLDAIVEFAEVHQFLDTPVKRYSSGMYVRLAFAVAAHLNPQILIIDEVLAVGDSAFQKKCLGKMGDIAKHEGRTVLFVSHNMQAVQSLCDRAILMESGCVKKSGPADQIVAQYLASGSEFTGEHVWPDELLPGNHEFKLKSIAVCNGSGDTSGYYSTKSDLYIEMEFTAKSNIPSLCVGFDLVTVEGVPVFRSYQTDSSEEKRIHVAPGKNIWRCRIPGGLLNGGTYHLCPRVSVHNMYWIVNMDAQVVFELTLDHGVSPFWNSLDRSNRPGNVAPLLEWSSKNHPPLNGAAKESASLKHNLSNKAGRAN